MGNWYGIKFKDLDFIFLYITELVVEFESEYIHNIQFVLWKKHYLSPL